jgi:hypothetical protein
MASPFNVFRRHQKVILVAAGVLCMFVFVIGDALFQFVATGTGVGGRNDGDEVAVRWNNGELTRRELASLETRRNILRNFLRSAVQLGMQRSSDPNSVPNVRGVVPLGEGREDLPETMVVFRHLLANKAKEAGIVVSDEAVNQYLEQLTQGLVSADELRQLVSNREAGGRRIGMNYVFEALREEMLATAYLDSYEPLLQTVTPAQRWADWRKLNDRVVIEHVAVPVGNFVDQVPDPSDEELVAFYELYKHREPNLVVVQPFTELPSPDPAFRVPRKAEVQYIEADYQTVAQQIEPDVTEEEIQKYYEQNKDSQFIRPQLDLGIEGADAAPPREGMPPEPEAEPQSSAAPGAVPDSANGQSSSQSPVATDASNPSLPAEGADVSSSADKSQPNPRTAEGPEEAEAAPDDQDATPPLLDDTSHRPLEDARSDKRMHFVLFQQEEEAADDAAGVAESSDVPLESDAASADGPLATEQPPSGVGETSSDSSVASDTPTTTESDDAARESALAGREGMPPEPAGATNVEYLPLDEVREQIRAEIARGRVEAKLLEIMPLVNSELLTIYRQYENRRLDAEADGKDPNSTPAPELDLQQIAQKYGRVAKQLTPMSQLELRGTPVGKSVLRDRSTPYWVYVFDQPRLEPAWTIGIPETLVEQLQGGFTQYIVLKVDESLARTPKFAEIRDEVVRVYKRVKARELAMAHAQQLAKDAEEADGTLQQQFTGNEQFVAVTSDPFAWYDKQFQRFHLAKPYGVQYAGPEFLETVFSLETGEVAAVWNHDKSVAYVVRLDRHQQSEDALRNRFLVEADRVDRFPEQGMLNALRSYGLGEALQRSIFAEAALEEVIPLDRADTGAS